MNEIFKPMLATDADLSKLKFPLLASAKLDGVRATVRDGIVFSRSNKPIPNVNVQGQFRDCGYFDGELIVGDPTSKTCYRDTVSGVMSKDGFPDVNFHVFDHIQYPEAEFKERWEHLAYQVQQRNRVILLEQYEVPNLEYLLKLEEEMLELGYEGLILRGPFAPYKNGRSTVNEGYLLKLKRFVDDEAEVIGFEERMHNGNEATVNELGRTKRSSHREGKTGRGDLGALLVRTGKVNFAIGTGFSDDERNTIWNNQARYLGAIAKYKHFPIGAKEAPRHPVFLGWRNKKDM